MVGEERRESIREQLRVDQARAEQQQAAFDAGEAAQWMYATIDAVAKDLDLSEDERDYAVGEIVRHWDDEPVPDLELLAIEIRKNVVDLQAYRNASGVRGLVSGQTRRVDALQTRIAAIPRVKSIEPLQGDRPSPLAEWRQTSDERGERQTAALAEMAAILREGSRNDRWMLSLTGASAFAATVAAVAAILALI